MPRWPESCRSCSHLAAPSNKCFCLFTAGSPAAWAPGGFVSSVHTVFSRVLGPEAGAARPALCMGTAMSAPRWPGASSPPQSPFGHAPFNNTLPVECQYKRMLRTQAGRGFLDACPRMGSRRAQSAASLGASTPSWCQRKRLSRGAALQAALQQRPGHPQLPGTAPACGGAPTHSL